VVIWKLGASSSPARRESASIDFARSAIEAGGLRATLFQLRDAFIIFRFAQQHCPEPQMKKRVATFNLSRSAKFGLGLRQFFPVFRRQFNQSFAFDGVGGGPRPSSVAIWRAWSELSMAS
jgi:hypothetical protein